jgi:anti-sigma B factor antagonist
MALIEPKSNGDILAIRINEPRLSDELTTQGLYHELLGVLENATEPNVVLDFGRVNFMSSSALGMLIRINKKCKERKIALKLSGISPNIHEVFKITGLDRVFEFRGDDPPTSSGTFARIEPRPSGGTTAREPESDNE